MSLNAKGTEMETIEYRTVDKSAWGAGPWQDEPDKVQWQDETTGLPCLIVRGPMGALCGYVGVADSHPWHGIGYSEPLDGTGKNYDDPEWWKKPSPEGSIDVHGGLTFSGACSAHGGESRGICHKPAPGEPDHVWWFGFDCAHLGDLVVDRMRQLNYRGFADEAPVYRDLAYVRAECASLARQLAAIR